MSLIRCTFFHKRSLRVYLVQERGREMENFNRGGKDKILIVVIGSIGEDRF